MGPVRLGCRADGSGLEWPPSARPVTAADSLIEINLTRLEDIRVMIQSLSMHHDDYDAPTQARRKPSPGLASASDSESAGESLAAGRARDPSRHGRRRIYPLAHWQFFMMSLRPGSFKSCIAGFKLHQATTFRLG